MALAVDAASSMHLDLPHQTYAGPALDDEAILARLPPVLASALRERNGCVAYLGGLHVRGACRAPSWHSLRAAWEGADAFHIAYPEVRPTDVPFAEDVLGDQFLLRDGAVIRLWAETGEVEPVAESLEAFFAALLTDAHAVLRYEPALAYRQAGMRLQPGQLLAAYPPFVLQESGQSVDLRPIDAMERRRFLAELAGRIRGLPDGTRIEFGTSD
jgi:hypothetical protein